MGVYLWKEGLPSEYQEVEYIQSSGTQWIDTGVIPTQNTKSQMKVLFVDYTGDVVYGMYNGNDNADYRLINKYNNNTQIGKCIFDFGTQRIMSSSAVFSTGTAYELEIGNYYVKDLSSGTNLASGTTISSYTGSRTITLNNYNNSTYSKNRWYYIKIYENNTLVRDFVPCYRKQDTEIGMYDLVNDTFYTNAGTGTFTKGNDIPDIVQKELKNAYIGEYGWQPGANTIAYYPFENDRNDYSGNNYNVTNARSTQLTTFNGVKCLNLNSSYCSVDTINTLTTANNYTILGWFYLTGKVGIEYNYSGSWGGGGFTLRHRGDTSEIRWGNTTNTYSQGNWSTPTGQWFMFALVAGGGEGGVYKNTTYTQLKSSGVIAPNNNATPLYIGANYEGTAFGNGYVSRLIIENKARTATEISNYYNSTKANYGL